MSADTKELKSLLHESIENIDDEELLRAAKSILDRKYEPKSVIHVSDYQKQRIEKAKASIDRGDYLTNEQADELVAKWLSMSSVYLVDVDQFEQIQKKLMLLEGLARGEKAILEGRVVSHADAKKRMARWLE